MRDYALTLAQSHDSFGAAVIGLLRNWRDRHETRKLLERDDAELRELGLTRQDVRNALRLPLSENCRLALEEVAFIRSLH